MRQPDFAKVFTSILDSTIASNWRVRHLFEDLMKLADWNGEIHMTPEAIARRTGWPHGLDALYDDLAILNAPDPESQSPECEGRRIVLLSPDRSWGWRVVNIETYRKMGDIEQVREKTRKRVADHRDRLKLVKNAQDAPESTISAPVMGEYLLRALRVLAPKLRVPEQSYVKLWLRKADGDEWRIIAALCEVELALQRAKSCTYVSRIVNERAAAKWQDVPAGEDAKAYAEHRLSLTAEGTRREW